jgi:two-component sensor histidine kinase
LLSRDQWTDIPLLDVLREELGPYMPSGKNPITLHGPDVFLRPKGALAFGMVVHELATNALKYGALSSPSGTVAIGWTIEAQEGEDVLLWYWREANGPTVTPPSQRGFGLSLIERSLSHEMNGEARLRFEPEGLHALLKIPFDSLVVSRATAKALQPS